MRRRFLFSNSSLYSSSIFPLRRRFIEVKQYRHQLNAATIIISRQINIYNKRITPTINHVPSIILLKKFFLSIPTQELKKMENNFEIENELFRIKRQIGGCFANGNYQSALEYSEDLLEKVEAIMGKKNNIYASCINNIAFAEKMAGKYPEAMEKYVKALHIYEDVVGKKHLSYASTLVNIGLLYKAMVERSAFDLGDNNDNKLKLTTDEKNEKKPLAMTALEKIDSLERAEEALSDAVAIRSELKGVKDKETLIAQVHLASIYRMQNKNTKAEQLLEDNLAMAIEIFGESDVFVGNIYNSLGLLYKLTKRYSDAETYYKKSIKIRENILGPSHNDTIVARHNLAELLIASGEVEKAAEIQKDIIEVVNGKNKAMDEKSSLSKAKKQEENKEEKGKGVEEGQTVHTTVTSHNNIDVIVHHTRKKPKPL